MHNVEKHQNFSVFYMYFGCDAFQETFDALDCNYHKNRVGAYGE